MLELQKQILLFFSGLQNPVLNVVGEFFTIFGEELIPIALALLIYWCIDKKKGFASCLVLLCNVNFVNLLKSIIRFPRPWVVDSSLSTLRKSTATGYSFPSGHSAAACCFYPSLALGFKKKWLKIVAIILVVMVPLSRLYLCCHWPMDVVCGSLIGLAICFSCYRFFENLCDDKEFCQKYMMLIGTVIFVIGLVMSILLQLEKIEYVAFSDLSKAIALLGSMLICYPIEQKFCNFSVKGSVKQKILRYVVGMVVALFIMTVVKKILPYLPVYSYFRYSLLAVWACLYPILGKRIGLFFS